MVTGLTLDDFKKALEETKSTGRAAGYTDWERAWTKTDPKKFYTKVSLREELGITVSKHRFSQKLKEAVENGFCTYVTVKGTNYYSFDPEMIRLSKE